MDANDVAAIAAFKEGVCVICGGDWYKYLNCDRDNCFEFKDAPIRPIIETPIERPVKRRNLIQKTLW